MIKIRIQQKVRIRIGDFKFGELNLSYIKAPEDTGTYGRSDNT